MSVAVQQVGCCFIMPQVPRMRIPKLLGSRSAAAVTPLWHPMSLL